MYKHVFLFGIIGLILNSIGNNTMPTYSSVLAQNGEEFSEDAAMRLGMIENIILTLFCALLFSTICISVWSGILLAVGNTQGGGPIGMLFSIWQNF